MNSRVTIILVIMAIYLAGMLWIGLKGRKYSETNKDFMTAAKQGSMLLVVGSYLGSHLGNGVVVGGAQYGALYGIGGLWYGAGAALSFVLFALVMSKIVYKKGYLTLPDVLSDRYGGKVVSVLIAILHYCTMIAICAGQIWQDAYCSNMSDCRAPPVRQSPLLLLLAIAPCLDCGGF